MELLLTKFMMAYVVAMTFVTDAMSYLVSLVVIMLNTYGRYVSDPYGFWYSTWVVLAIATTAPGNTWEFIPSRTALSTMVQLKAQLLIPISKHITNPTYTFISIMIYL